MPEQMSDEKTNSNYRTYAFLLLLAFPIYPLYGTEEIKIDYPSGYRNWIHVKTGLIDEKHPLFEQFGGIHHIYANRPALQAMKTESEYPNGSAFVFDLIVSAPYDGGIAEGERRTKLEDVIPLCANCHRTAHTRKPPIPIEELRRLVTEERD